MKPRFALALALASIVGGSGCGGDKKPEAATSAAPVDPAKADPACTKATKIAVAERCEKGGEMSCCTQLIDGKIENDPKEIEDYGIACRGGHLKACDVVREADKDFAWKLGVYRAACPRMGHAACRHAVFLAALVDPKGLEGDVKAHCDKEKDGITVGTMPLECGKKIESLKPIQHLLDACNDGTFAACKRLADIDGNAATMMQRSLVSLWTKRGVSEGELADVFEGRVAPPPFDTKVEPKGTVTTKVTGDKPAATTFGDALAKRKDELRACVALGDPKDDRKGTTKFDVVLGKDGAVVFSKGVDSSAPLTITDCVRWIAQTTGGGTPGRLKVELSFTR